MTRWRPIVIAALAAVSVAVVGGLMTDIGSWYLSLKQPAWKPPDRAFGPIWTTIFALAAAAGVIGWRRAPSRAARETMLVLFAVNGFLNVFWSPAVLPPASARLVALRSAAAVAVGAGADRAARALREAGPRGCSRPYLVWVAIAAALNWQTVKLNGPFG